MLQSPDRFISSSGVQLAIPSGVLFPSHQTGAGHCGGQSGVGIDSMPSTVTGDVNYSGNLIVM